MRLKTAPLNRLSKAEFARTVQDLVGPDVMRALPALSGLLAGIPDDDRTGGFANLSWTLSADHVATYLAIASELGAQTARQPALRGKLVPCAGADPVPESCAATLVETIATRAYRRPLEAGEKSDLLAFYSDAERASPGSGFGSLLTRILLSPNFLLREKPPSSSADCDVQRADESYRLASRISFGLWGRPPDDQLLAAAGRHDLFETDTLAAQIERMIDDSRTREWMRTFFREWLHYDHMPVEGYAAEFLAGVDRAHLHERAAEELDRFIETIVWTDRGGFFDLMTSRKVVTTAPALRTIYGLPAAAPRGVEQAPANRAGLLTRVALLAQGHNEANTVKRGAFVRRQILCDNISPPDPSLLPPGSLVPPEPDYKLTTRQRWEARTRPAACMGCHRRFNQFGFSLEAYDGIGRYRTVEHQLIPNSNPQKSNALPIDAKVVPAIDSPDEPVAASPVALSEALGKSARANRCFVRQLTRFVSGRPNDSADAATINALADALMASGGSVRGTLAGIVKDILAQPQ